MTRGDIDGWYKTLARPPLAPPDFIFPVVWTSLYVMIAAAGWRIFHFGSGQRLLRRLYMGYMALNWTWSYIFFSLHLMFAGFIWILALDVLAFLFILKSWKTDRVTAVLMVPPLIWTVFAAYLNGAYWFLNR